MAGTAWLYATPAIGLRQGEDIVNPVVQHFLQSLNRVVVAAPQLYLLDWGAGVDRAHRSCRPGDPRRRVALKVR